MMSPKSRCPPAQAEDQSYFDGRAFQGVSFRASPHAHPRGWEPPESKGTYRHLFFFGFIMKTKQMPQEKGP